MRILLSTYGSRGDVQPLVALALALQARGVEAVVSAPADPEFIELLDRAGVPLEPGWMPTRHWIETAKQLGLPLPQLVERLVPAQYEAIASAAAKGCDLIVATGLFPSKAVSQMVAEKMGIPYFSLHFCPLYLPSPHHAPLVFPGHPLPPGVTGNLALWDHNAAAMNAIFGAPINTFRAELGLPTLTNVRDHVFTDRPLIASDAALSPWQPTEVTNAIQTGALLLPDARPLPPALEAFLDAGDPPVHVGFGSMAMHGTEDPARIAIRAIRARGRRVVIARGWAGLEPIDAGEDVFAVGEVNQQALFPRVAAVIHHGGAGTTVTATAAGAPQLVVPQVADQPYFASRVAALGIGAAHDGPVPSFESLSAGLGVALAPETKERAGAVARTIRRDGAAVAAEVLIAAIQN